MFILSFKSVDGDVDVVYGDNMEDVNAKLQALAIEGRLDLEDWSDYSHAVLLEVDSALVASPREFSTNLIPYLEVED